MAWAPRVRAGFLRTFEGAAAQGSAQARLRFMGAELEACPARWTPFAPLAVRPCAIVEGGILVARGENVPDAHATTPPLLNVGAVLHVEAALAFGFALEADAALVVAVFRRRFFVDPQTTLYATPRTGGRAGAALSYHFR